MAIMVANVHNSPFQLVPNLTDKANAAAHINVGHCGLAVSSLSVYYLTE